MGNHLHLAVEQGATELSENLKNAPALRRSLSLLGRTLQSQ